MRKINYENLNVTFDESGVIGIEVSASGRAETEEG